MLFDTGPEDRVFEQNVSRLGLDLGPVEAMVLSHGHWDHAGAMLRALQLVLDRNGGAQRPLLRRIPTCSAAAPSRCRTARSGRWRTCPRWPTLDAQGGRVVSTREPQAIADDTVFVSGEIPRRTPFETGLPGQHRRTADGKGWEPDELLIDERFVAVNVRGKGLVVLTACSHAGVVNVLDARARVLSRREAALPCWAACTSRGINERVIPQTVEALKGFDLDVIAAGHCTGWRAMAALANAFGDRKLDAAGGGQAAELLVIPDRGETARS